MMAGISEQYDFARSGDDDAEVLADVNGPKFIALLDAMHLQPVTARIELQVDGGELTCFCSLWVSRSSASGKVEA